MLKTMAVKKVAGTKDEQVMAVFIKRCMQTTERKDIYVFTAFSKRHN